ncbi:MAG: NnrS family protein [Betaproteobacteria bacterium]|nr:NnrS family protein [Betaproteobacteria bacterium]
MSETSSESLPASGFFQHVFFSAPHRVMFLAGGVQALLTVIFWCFDLGARYADLYPAISWGVPASWLHTALMIYGFFSFYIFGFLMTALPKWVGAKEVVRGFYLSAFLLLIGGWLLFYMGLFLPPEIPVFSVAMLVVALGWLVALYALLAAIRDGENPDKRHAKAVCIALLLGWIGILSFACAFAFSIPFAGTIFLFQHDLAYTAARQGIEIGIWGFLLPVFATVTHRMLPFFTGNVLSPYTVYRPMGLLWVLLVCLVAHGLGALVGKQSWLWLPDSIAALLSFWFSWKWQLRRGFFASHLLAMHHVAHLWLGIALSLYAAQSIAHARGVDVGGLAPQHVLTLGYFASVLIGMATRVTLGHSGRSIDSDVWGWRLFWCLQGVVLLRFAGEFLGSLNFMNLFWWSTILWVLIFALWCRVYVPMYLKPRPDGRPG